MKKILLIILILVCFFLGLSLGEASFTKSKLLEEEIEYFEEEIVKPNNYENLEFKPKKNLFNKIASTIEKTLNAVFEKISEKL